MLMRCSSSNHLATSGAISLFGFMFGLFYNLTNGLNVFFSPAPGFDFKMTVVVIYGFELHGNWLLGKRGRIAVFLCYAIKNRNDGYNQNTNAMLHPENPPKMLYSGSM